jgi:hypothetical protein
VLLNAPLQFPDLSYSPMKPAERVDVVTFDAYLIIAKMLINSDKILKKSMNGEKSPPADRRTSIKRWMSWDRKIDTI